MIDHIIKDKLDYAITILKWQHKSQDIWINLQISKDNMAYSYKNNSISTYYEENKISSYKHCFALFREQLV